MAGEIPFEVTSFVGRRAEVSEVKRLLQRSRLVTLVGTGGVGKTRLAFRAASDLRRAFGPDGVRAVELAGLEDPELLADEVASALGLRNDAVHWQLGALAERIAGRRLLLVLDDCERLVDSVAVLADGLLRSCPALRILATSREPLRVAGETTFRVPSLSLPASEDAPAAAPSRSEAVRLFLERAEDAAPGFVPTEADLATIVAICRRLDGIPLAIELAAVRVRSLPLDAILEHLDDRFGLLDAGPAAPTRHQTLDAAMRWSHDLLGEPERVAWRRLSVFSGGFDLPAAGAVLRGRGDDPLSAVELVAALVERSIVTFEPAQGGAGRYRLGETLRRFGRERLVESGEESAMRRRHRDWFAGLAGTAEASWLRRDNLVWLDRLGHELDNLRAAFDFCLEVPGEAEHGIAMASDLWMFWTARGHVREGRHWLDALLAADARPTAARAAGLMTAAVLARVQGDYADAAAGLAESRRVADEVGDRERAGLATAELAIVAAERGSIDDALELLEAARLLRGRRGDRIDRSYVEYRATVLNAAGRPDEAERMLEEALELCEEAGDRWREAWALRALAAARWQRGSSGEARSALVASLHIAAELDDERAIAGCADVASWIEAGDGDARRAARLAGAADAAWASLGLTPPASWAAARETAREKARARLGADAFVEAVREGATLTRPVVVRLALGEGPPGEGSAGPARGAAPRPLTDRVRGGGVGQLSRRELEVASLVAAGFSNKEVAARLLVSVRTVDTHMDHILRKLGLASRVDLAVWHRDMVTGGDGSPDALPPRPVPPT